jgi:hypothetical protein
MIKRQNVAIVGGGIQGTTCALACAAAGWSVTLFERRAGLWLGASGQNEGKIHLGYTYGLDRSGRTRARLADLGSRFETDLEALTGPLPADVLLSREVAYARHADSELEGDATAAHFAATADLAGGRVRQWSAAELGATFSDKVTDAWTVDEITVEPVRLGRHVTAAVAAKPGIELVTGVEVRRIGEDGSIWGQDGRLGTFDRVLNCAWDGLAALDPSAQGLCLRAKAGFIAPAGGVPPSPVTFSFGPFGDVVPLGEGRVYVSWYPSCLMGFTTDAADGRGWFETVAGGFDFDAAYARTREAFHLLLPGLRLAPRYDEIRAGAILAAGRTDIYDPASQLHERTVIGLTAQGKVASINPGKLTTAPAYAHQAARWLSTN